MKLIPDNFKSEINKRIQSVRQKMSESDIEALFVGYNTNVYYLTGGFFRGYVYLPIEGEPLWLVIKPDIFSKEDNVISIRKPEQLPEILKGKNMKFPSSVGLEFDSLSYSDIKRLEKIFPDTKIVNGSYPLIRSRMIKTDWEVSQMKKDGILQARVYGEVKNCYHEGMTDLQLQIEIERQLRLAGSLGFTRTAGNLMDINMGSLVAGDNADNPSPYDFTMGGSGMDSSLPVGANGHILKPGETVMVDMNGAFNAYQTDMTRVWRKGEIPEIAFRAHDCSIEIMRFLEDFVVPGVSVASLYEKALEIVELRGLDAYFMGHASQVNFIGHGVGLELNEPPVIMKKSKDLIKKNMTLAIEPKFVIPGVGAVGIENTYVVNETGLENLTSFPEEIQLL